MKTVMNPKVLGAWNLHQLSKDIPLDFFILFSSAASLFGSPGQINHVVANTFLDDLAKYRKAQGLPGLSLNWGTWSDIGAAAKNKADRNMKLKGINAISPQDGLQILETLITQSTSQIGIVPIEWSRFIAADYNLPLVSDFKLKQPTKNNFTDASNFLQEIKIVEDKLNFLINYLQKEVGKILGMPPNQLPDTNKGFFDMGIDSLMVIELKTKLETNLQTTIPSTAIFEYSNINLLANYIFEAILHLETTKIELPAEQLEDAIIQELTDLESLLG